MTSEPSVLNIITLLFLIKYSTEWMCAPLSEGFSFNDLLHAQFPVLQSYAFW